MDEESVRRQALWEDGRSVSGGEAGGHRQVHHRRTFSHDEPIPQPGSRTRQGGCCCRRAGHFAGSGCLRTERRALTSIARRCAPCPDRRGTFPFSRGRRRSGARSVCASCPRWWRGRGACCPTQRETWCRAERSSPNLRPRYVLLSCLGQTKGGVRLTRTPPRSFVRRLVTVATAAAVSATTT